MKCVFCDKEVENSVAVRANSNIPLEGSHKNCFNSEMEKLGVRVVE